MDSCSWPAKNGGTRNKYMSPIFGYFSLNSFLAHSENEIAELGIFVQTLIGDNFP